MKEILDSSTKLADPSTPSPATAATLVSASASKS
jgi:hypothetical protein